MAKAVGIQQAVPDNIHNTQDATKATLKNCIINKTNLKDKIKTETKQLMKKIIHSRNKHLLHTYKTNPKQINRATFRGRSSSQLTKIRHPHTGAICTTPRDMMEALQAYHTDLLTPKWGKTGNYTAEIPRHYPWITHAQLSDGFTGIQTCCDQKEQEECHLNTWSMITSDTTFNSILKHLSNNKAPGPDGVTNELLKCAPEVVQQHLHTIIKCMWHTRHTPTQLKQSDTVLLYKKGDPADPSNYRPIALANTIYKLWTAHVTLALTTTAEKYGMLSDMQ